MKWVLVLLLSLASWLLVAKPFYFRDAQVPLLYNEDSDDFPTAQNCMSLFSLKGFESVCTPHMLMPFFILWKSSLQKIWKTQSSKKKYKTFIILLLGKNLLLKFWCISLAMFFCAYVFKLICMCVYIYIHLCIGFGRFCYVSWVYFSTVFSWGLFFCWAYITKITKFFIFKKFFVKPKCIHINNFSSINCRLIWIYIIWWKNISVVWFFSLKYLLFYGEFLLPIWPRNFLKTILKLFSLWSWLNIGLDETTVISSPVKKNKILKRTQRTNQNLKRFNHFLAFLSWKEEEGWKLNSFKKTVRDVPENFSLTWGNRRKKSYWNF